MIHHICRTLVISALASLSLSAQEEGFVPLFDGKSLENWQAAKGNEKAKFGAFTVDEGEKAIHVYAGEENGSEKENDCLVSKKAFSHFVLKLEYKWGENRFAPRPDWDRDAGLLFHVHGDLKKVWPDSLEMQIGESPGDKKNGQGNDGRFHVGDLFVLGESLRVDVRKKDGAYDPKAPLQTGTHVETRLGVEKPHGEWNEIEIRVDGAKKATYLLNGEIVFEMENFVYKNEAGEVAALEKGHIGLQAEWAEIFYRNIVIKELPSK